MQKAVRSITSSSENKIKIVYFKYINTSLTQRWFRIKTCGLINYEAPDSLQKTGDFRSGTPPGSYEARGGQKRGRWRETAATLSSSSPSMFGLMFNARMSGSWPCRRPSGLRSLPHLTERSSSMVSASRPVSVSTR